MHIHTYLHTRSFLRATEVQRRARTQYGAVRGLQASGARRFLKASYTSSLRPHTQVDQGLKH